MSAIRRVEFSNGCEVGLGSMVASRADVIFPVKTIKAMSAEDIGRIAKEMAESAELLYFQEVDTLYTESYLRGCPDEDLFELEAELDAFPEFPQILEFRNRVKVRAEKRRQRIKAKSNSMTRRREFAQVRDELFLQVGRRDGFECRNCTATKDLTVDHIQPIVEGGTDDLNNLQILCRKCNSRKGDK